MPINVALFVNQWIDYNVEWMKIPDINDWDVIQTNMNSIKNKLLSLMFNSFGAFQL